MELSLFLLELVHNNYLYRLIYCIIPNFISSEDISYNKIIFSDKLWYNLQYYELLLLLDITLSPEEFNQLSEIEQQNIYLTLLSYGTSFTIPKFTIDINSSIIYLVLLANENIKNVIVFQENNNFQLKQLNFIDESVNKLQYILEEDFFFGRELKRIGISLQNITDINSNLIQNLYNKYHNHLVDDNFFDELNNRKLIPSSTTSSIIKDNLFEKYLELLNNRTIFPSSENIKVFSTEETHQEYGKINEKTINLFSKTEYFPIECSIGKLKMKIIPSLTFLYTMSTKPKTKQNLNYYLWSFWDVEDLTYQRIDHYNHEYKFEYVNVLRTTQDYTLLDMSDPETVERLQCDPRSTKSFRKLIDYAFRIINSYTDIDGKQSEIPKKIIYRNSHSSMDSNFTEELKKLYPEFSGFIYTRNENTSNHHNEIYMFSGNNVDSIFYLKLDELELLSKYDYYDSEPTLKIRQNFVNAYYHREMMEHSNFALIISILINLFYSENINKNITIEEILLRIVYSYLITPLAEDYEKELSALRIDNKEFKHSDFGIKHILNKNILYTDKEFGNEINIPIEHFSNLNNDELYTILTKIFNKNSVYKIVK